jgi:anti-sigma factor RsiW
MADTQHTHNCKELLEQIHDYIDGELEAKLCAELEQHLTGCDDCRVLVDTTEKMLVLYRRQYRRNQVALSENTSNKLWQALEESGCVSRDNNSIT